MPWRVGTVRLDCGPSVVVHLHGDVEVPALKAGATQDVKAAGQGQGITGYRYKQK